MLGANLTTYSAAFGDICQEAVTKLNEGQRELSRQFTPVIAAAMEPAYEQCNEERGKGSFARMKAAMAAHVGGKGDDMFQDAAEQVKASLQVCPVHRPVLTASAKFMQSFPSIITTR